VQLWINYFCNIKLEKKENLISLSEYVKGITYNEAMKSTIHFIISTIAIMVTSYILPGVHVDGLLVALVLAVVLGVINTILRPILVILTLPLSIMTLGLSVLVINALLVLLATYIVPGFSVNNFWWVFLFGIVLAIVNWVLQIFEKK